MAEFKLKQETIDLLKESEIDSEGHIKNISYLNDELKQIVQFFICVSQSWWQRIAGPTICSDGDWMQDILLKRIAIKQTTITTNNGLHYVLQCEKIPPQPEDLLKVKDIAIPEDIPISYYMDSVFNEENGTLRVLQNPPMGNKYTPVFSEGKVIIDGKEIKMRPQLIAIYRLFKEHSEGLVLKEILTKYKDELLSYYKEQNQGNDFYENFKEGIDTAKNKLTTTDKINHLISNLKKDLETKNAGIVMPFHNIRSLCRKGHNQIYFVPYFFLNESNISIGTNGKRVHNK